MQQMHDPHYEPDPPRGCGRKVPGGFYAEADFAPPGPLNAWTWCLGDGVEGGFNCTAVIPPRRALFGNLAATLAVGEFISLDVPFDPHTTGVSLAYKRLSNRTSREALFDHVGAVHYTAASFADEVRLLGPSRRMPPQMARIVAGMVPLPAVYTFPLPRFRTEAQRAAVIDLLPLLIDDLEPVSTTATWMETDWGIYAGMDDGRAHYMRPLLGILDRIQNEWDLVGANPYYRQMRALLDDAPLVETPFGVSWITKVNYVPKPDDPAGIAANLAQFGIGVLDLEGQAS